MKVRLPLNLRYVTQQSHLVAPQEIVYPPELYALLWEAFSDVI
jgi:hypothetical protein